MKEITAERRLNRLIKLVMTAVVQTKAASNVIIFVNYKDFRSVVCASLVLHVPVIYLSFLDGLIVFLPNQK